MFLFQNPTNLLVEQFDIDGITYGFNKNLWDINFGEYIDMENFSKDTETQLDYLMAILYRPVKKEKPKTIKKLLSSYIHKQNKYVIEEYDITSVKERAELFKEYMEVDKVLGAVFFFLILRLIYIENTKKSLTKKEMMLMTKIKMREFGVIFKEDGVG
jgi:hypothetical protein